MITLQYLEYSPDLINYTKEQILTRLRSAYQRLPFSHLLVGWHVPPPLLEACRADAERLGVRFLRWQPLLTTDQVVQHQPGWGVQGINGRLVEGFHRSLEFAFACPNHPALQEALFTHLDTLVHQGLYQGFFLDRVRFPSPSVRPLADLACFCEHCRRKAAGYGIDLEELRREIMAGMQADKGRVSLVQTLLDGGFEPGDAGFSGYLSQFLRFRERCIVDLLARVTQVLRQAQMEIGLDCYSPCLAIMVGQDLSALGRHADWVKLMTYAHTHAPAGLPYELSGLASFISSDGQMSPRQSLALVSRFAGLPLPNSYASLRGRGLSAHALEKEVRRGVALCPAPVLAGLELVKLAGVTNQTAAHLRADLAGINQARPAGLALSWDLLYMPLEWLDLVRQGSQVFQ